jgi:hypothetical protein
MRENARPGLRRVTGVPTAEAKERPKSMRNILSIVFPAADLAAAGSYSGKLGAHYGRL